MSAIEPIKNLVQKISKILDEDPIILNFESKNKDHQVYLDDLLKVHTKEMLKICVKQDLCDRPKTNSHSSERLSEVFTFGLCVLALEKCQNSQAQQILIDQKLIPLLKRFNQNDGRFGDDGRDNLGSSLTLLYLVTQKKLSWFDLFGRGWEGLLSDEREGMVKSSVVKMGPEEVKKVKAHRQEQKRAFQKEHVLIGQQSRDCLLKSIENLSKNDPDNLGLIVNLSWRLSAQTQWLADFDPLEKLIQNWDKANMDLQKSGKINNDKRNPFAESLLLIDINKAKSQSTNLKEKTLKVVQILLDHVHDQKIESRNDQVGRRNKIINELAKTSLGWMQGLSGLSFEEKNELAQKIKDVLSAPWTIMVVKNNPVNSFFITEDPIDDDYDKKSEVTPTAARLHKTLNDFINLIEFLAQNNDLKNDDGDVPALVVKHLFKDFSKALLVDLKKNRQLIATKNQVKNTPDSQKQKNPYDLPIRIEDILNLLAENKFSPQYTHEKIEKVTKSQTSELISAIAQDPDISQTVMFSLLDRQKLPLDGAAKNKIFAQEAERENLRHKLFDDLASRLPEGQLHDIMLSYMIEKQKKIGCIKAAALLEKSFMINQLPKSSSHSDPSRSPAKRKI